MIPENDGCFNPSDGWLMDILMKLGSAQTILSALCRSIEKVNPGIAVALVCPDRRSGKLTYFMAPNSPGRFSPSHLRLQYLIEGLDSENSACANGTGNLWRSVQLGSDAGGSSLWSSGTLSFSAEHDFGLLAVCQSPESLPPALDLDSLRSAMSLAIRIFGRQSAHTPIPNSPEVHPQGQVTASRVRVTLGAL